MFRAPPLLAMLIALSGSPVAAHGTCGERGRVIAQLGFRYGEARKGGVLPRSVMPLELYVNRATGSWTLLRAHPPARMCIEGFGWIQTGIAPEPKEKGI